MKRLGLSAGLAALAASCALLASSGAEAASPYFGTNYDCSPIMTDAQALDVTDTTRNVVESSQVFAGKGYSCSWSLGTNTRAITLVVGTAPLKQRAYRLELAESLCDGNPLSLSKAAKAELCDAAEDFVSVKTPREAFEAYATLIRAMVPGSAKTRFESRGVRGYWVNSPSRVGAGGAMTMLPFDWTVVTAACLNMATHKVERECSIDALEVVLRNFRLAGAPGALSPLPKGMKKK